MSASRISPAPSRTPPDSLGTAVPAHHHSVHTCTLSAKTHQPFEAMLHCTVEVFRGVPYQTQIRPNPTTIWQARLVSEPHPHPHHLTPPFHTPSLQPWPPQSYPPASLHAQALLHRWRPAGQSTAGFTAGHVHLREHWCRAPTDLLLSCPAVARLVVKRSPAARSLSRFIIGSCHGSTLALARYYRELTPSPTTRALCYLQSAKLTLPTRLMCLCL